MGRYNHPKDPYGWRVKSYIDLLGGALKRHNPETRILQLTEPQGRKTDIVGARPQDEKSTTGWPCSPRHGPVIGQPDMIFDLPGYQANMHNDILDWGKWDLLIAALGDKIFMWHSPSNNVLTVQTFRQDTIMAVKWDPSGELIAIGTLLGHLYIYDSISEKIINVSWKCQRSLQDMKASIAAVSWCTKGDKLACGTVTGTIGVCDKKIKEISVMRCNAHAGDILVIRHSPDDRYLVTSGMDCMVRLWCLPDIIPYFEILYENPSRAIAWHPWRGCQLAVGGGGGAGDGIGDGSLSIWNVSKLKNLCHRLPKVDCAVDALAWSVHTAELVVSYWIQSICLENYEEDGSESYSKLIVLSEPCKVTDELRTPPGRTRALLFNPDGTKLASASSHENLYVWNFLGKPGPLLNMYKRKMKREKLYLNYKEINEFNNFGNFIR